MMTVHDAALRFYRGMRGDPHPLLIPVQWVEGRHIPEGTFDEFIHELKGMGICIHKYRQGKSAVVSGF